MEYPEFLSTFMRSYVLTISDDQHLLEKLKVDPLIAADFFMQSCDDLMWVHQHENLLSQLLSWLTQQFLISELSLQKAKDLAQVIQNNYGEMSGIVKPDFSIRGDKEEFLMNGLLFGSASDFFRAKALEKYRVNQIEVITLPGMQDVILQKVCDYLNYGVVDLWKIDLPQLLDLIRQAEYWNLFSLKRLGEERLTHYVDRGNLLEMFQFSHENQLFHLRSTCVKLLNRFENDLQVMENGHLLTFIFYRFRIRTLEIFERLKNFITCLVCQGDLILDKAFEEVVNEIPHLKILDISQSQEASEYLLTIPQEIEELNLSACSWLNANLLNQLTLRCPRLKVLKLNRNEQLDYAAWTSLQNLKRLEHLEISGCSYLTDQELKIIISSCPQLEILHLNDCSQLTRQAFFEMSKILTDLKELHVKRGNLDDSTLIQVISNCPNLNHLNLSYNRQITDQGLLQVIKMGRQLATLDLVQTSISARCQSQLKKNNPHLSLNL